VTFEAVVALRGSPAVGRRTCSTGEPRERYGMGPIGVSKLGGAAHQGGRMW
jgi:hypothetical protein